MSIVLNKYSDLTKTLQSDGSKIVSGPPGCGKSYQARKLYPDGKFIRGGISAAGLIRHLAVLAYDENEHTVILDDCEDLIKQNVNLFKAILDTDYPYAEWEKAMGPTLRALQKDTNPMSMELYTRMMKFFNGVGLTIPTDKLKFVVLTNEHITNQGLISRCHYATCAPDFNWVCDALELSTDKASELKLKYSGSDIRKAVQFL